MTGVWWPPFHRRPGEGRGPGVGHRYGLNARYRRTPTFPTHPYAYGFVLDDEHAVNVVRGWRASGRVFKEIPLGRNVCPTHSSATVFLRK